jgi:outer membrane immunogenic protein
MYRLLAGIVALTLAGPAVAQPYNWTGLYVGAHGGWASGGWDGPLSYDDASLYPALDFDYSSKSLDADGWLGGGQIGFNQQFGGWVLGIVVDASATDLSSSGTFNPYPALGPDPSWTVKTSLEALGTIRGKLGLLVSPGVMIYGTGGFAIGQVDSDIAVNYQTTPCGAPGVPEPCATGSHKSNHIGYSVGGGFEIKLAPRWSLGTEYVFVDLGSEDYGFTGTTHKDLGSGIYGSDHLHADLEFHTVRATLNFQLSAEEGIPVPLK